jgi:poly-gamma-glutamate synthesis protein (capsule biosynthesis protein)
VHRGAVAAGAVAFLALVAAGCASGPQPTLGAAAEEATSSSVTAPTTTTPATTTTVPPSSTTEAPRPVTLAFGGDVYGQSPVREVLARGDNPLAAVTPLLGGADVAIVNLETAVGTTGAPRDKEFVFQADPTCSPRSPVRVSMSSVANNHSLTTASTASSGRSTTFATRRLQHRRRRS